MEETQLKRRNFLKAAVASTVAAGTLSATAAQAETASSKKDVVKAASKIPRKLLGTTGASVPILQLGTSQRLDPKYDRIMHRCFKEGVDYFDTALSYGWGSSHRAIANFLKQMGDRKNIWLTSKSGSEDPDELIRDIDQCLSELETDYLDLYLMHGVNDTDLLGKDFIRAGEKLRKSGKTRFFGFSCHSGNVVELMNLAAKVGGIDAILFRYNFRRYGDRELNLAIDACKKAGIGLMAMKTMGSVPSGAEKVVKFQSQDFTLAQAKLKSVWADERIDTVVSEMDSVRVTRENVAAAKTEKSLAASDMHQLHQLAAQTAHLSCQGCSNLCEASVAQNVRIADTLRFLMYHECYGQAEKAQALYRALPQEERQFNNVDFTAATKICPQGIDIENRIKHAQNLLA